jgi:hypothetical protein
LASTNIKWPITLLFLSGVHLQTETNQEQEVTGYVTTFPVFYEIQRFIIMFTRLHHRTVILVNSVHNKFFSLRHYSRKYESLKRDPLLPSQILYPHPISLCVCYMY